MVPAQEGDDSLGLGLSPPGLSPETSPSLPAVRDSMDNSSCLISPSLIPQQDSVSPVPYDGSPTRHASLLGSSPLVCTPPPASHRLGGGRRTQARAASHAARGNTPPGTRRRRDERRDLPGPVAPVAASTKEANGGSDDRWPYPRASSPSELEHHPERGETHGTAAMAASIETIGTPETADKQREGEENMVITSSLPPEGGVGGEASRSAWYGEEETEDRWGEVGDLSLVEGTPRHGQECQPEKQDLSGFYAPLSVSKWPAGFSTREGAVATPVPGKGVAWGGWGGIAFP